MRVIISRGLQVYSRARLWRRKLKKATQIGVLGGALNGIRMCSWYVGLRPPDLMELCERCGIPVFETDYTSSDETVQKKPVDWTFLQIVVQSRILFERNGELAPPNCCS